MTPPTRKYAMIRVASGDYLLPSNDGRTLWRIRRYEEDGSAEVQTERGWRKVLGSFWSASRYYQPIPPAGEAEEAERFLRGLDVDDPEKWSEALCGCRTRGEAINEALVASEREGG